MFFLKRAFTHVHSSIIIFLKKILFGDVARPHFKKTVSEMFSPSIFPQSPIPILSKTYRSVSFGSWVDGQYVCQVVFKLTSTFFKLRSTIKNTKETVH